MLGPATEVLVFIEQEHQVEDVYWLESITNQLHFNKKSHACLNKPMIEFRDVPQSARDVVAMLKQVHRCKAELVLGCFLLKPNLEDYTEVTNCARTWLSAPCGLSSTSVGFYACFETQPEISPIEAAHHLHTTISNAGFTLNMRAVAHSSILVFFSAPASFPWLYKLQLQQVQTQIAYKGLELKYFSHVNVNLLSKLMKMEVNKPFQFGLLDLFNNIAWARRLKPKKGSTQQHHAIAPVVARTMPQLLNNSGGNDNPYLSPMDTTAEYEVVSPVDLRKNKLHLVRAALKYRTLTRELPMHPTSLDLIARSVYFKVHDEYFLIS